MWKAALRESEPEGSMLSDAVRAKIVQAAWTEATDVAASRRPVGDVANQER
jgi:hypothetical protein